MRRVMSLWLPRWPIERRRSGRPAPDKPFVLAVSVGNRRLVSAVNAGAEALGIAPGLPLTDARALHPGLSVAAADLAGDAAALRRLAQWCTRYSPWTAPDGADGVFLDVTGCAHLQGGEAALTREMVERLRQRGIAGRVAIADTAGAAWAVARCGGAVAAVVLPGNARAALADLPIAALRLDPVAGPALERLGLRRIGDLYPLPRAALAARFGDGVAARLDQALGAAAEPLSPLPPAPARWARRRFAEPIGTPEALAAATRDLLETLCRALGEEMLGARRLVLSVYRVDGAATPVAIGTARPSRDPRHLFRLFAERLAEIDPGLGIEDMLLAATAVETLAPAQIEIPLSHASSLPSAHPHRPSPLEGEVGSAPALPGGGWTQRGCTPAILDALRATPLLPEASGLGHPPPQGGRGTQRVGGEGTIARQMARAMLAADGKDRDGNVAELVDRLANRLGQHAVGCLEPRQSHLPERAQWLAPVFAAKFFSCPSGARPIRLLPRPEPIEAVAPVPDDPPIRFRWRRLAHRVRRADGPERLCGEWWRSDEEAAVLRDYYRVEDEAGRRFWLYRDGLYLPAAAPRWFLHGLFA